MTGQCLQSQQQTRERSHVSHYQGKVTAYPVTHRFHWPVTTIRHHQPGIIMFNRFYLGPTSNIKREWMGFSNYFCLNTRGEAQTFWVIIFSLAFETFSPPRVFSLCCWCFASFFFFGTMKSPRVCLDILNYCIMKCSFAFLHFSCARFDFLILCFF